MQNVPNSPGALPPVQPQSPNPSTLTKLEKTSILLTVGFALTLVVFSGFASYYYRDGSVWTLYLVASVGALGGLAHEIAQSGGKIMLFQRKADGFYLGSVAGMLLGAVAALLSARLLFADPHPVMTAAQLNYEAFLAGLGLKSIVEAVGGQPVNSITGQPPLPPQLGTQMQLPPPPSQVPTE